MKLSLKLVGEDEKDEQIMTAKVPITIFSNPFISGVTATTSSHSPSHFSFSLSTNFPSGPSLSLSYSPSASLPFSLSLKSGLGLLGSPAHSPLVFSASFSGSSLSPSFFLHFKPQFGHFSLRKTWHNLKLEPCGDTHSNNHSKHALSPNIRVMARTVVPVAKGFLLSFRWGVNFPRTFGSKMPSLTVNKIRLERVHEPKDDNDNKEASETDLQLLKGMCVWMGKDLEKVERENREMKRVLDEVKLGISTTKETLLKPNRTAEISGAGEFQRRGSYKSGRQEEDVKKQPNTTHSDVESELQKAIKAATAS
ncbi:hypothetical protein Fmac_002251 [Flemingia macrophylla]|uniref:Uncharacterized protein n=1 Tax=Flemingia macrophylla TaxID=520843 RepID=A0ABD1NJD3_9FABA